MKSHAAVRRGRRTAASDCIPPVFQTTRSIGDDAAERDRTDDAVRRAVAGDNDGLRYLYERYSNGVYSYVRTIVRSADTAEDVTQQVFLKLMTALPRYDAGRATFAAWLLRMARNAAIDSIRNSHGVVTAAEIEPDREQPAPDDRRESLRTALGGLTEGQRRVFVLREVVGLSACEVGECLGKKEAAVHTLHHRARVAAKESLVAMDVAPLTKRAA
jgi:RNA polymerase sigma-70 factor (ECF subfamily)